MANSFEAVIPKLLAQGVMALRQNAVMTRLVNRSYESLAAQKGDVINVPLPSAIAARDVSPDVVFASNQDSAPTSAQVTLDFWKEASFHLTDKDLQEVMNGTIPMQASEAIKSLANEVDKYIMGKHIGFFGFVGTPGTAPFASAITTAGDARKKLNKQLAPASDRRAVLDPDAEANLLALPNILDFDKRGDQGGIINGSIGHKLGFDWYMDQNVSSYTPGTAWVTGFAAAAAAASGATTMSVINVTAAGSIKAGDIFSVGNGQYVVTASVTASASVALTISFYPALATAVASASGISVLGSTYTANLAFHRDAIAWASRPLADVNGLGNQMMSAVDPVSGVALRLEVSRQYKQTTFSYDILGGANVIRRELGVKILG